MGFAITLVATPAEQRAALLSAAGVGMTDTPDPHLAGPVSAGVVGDHFVIWHNLRSYRTWATPDPVVVSKGTEALFLTVVDTVGAQELRFFRDGQQIWCAAFSEAYPDMLHSEGPVPYDVMDIVAELEAADPEPDADVDPVIFYGGQVPGLIFQRIVGMHHEEHLPEGFCLLDADLPLAKDGGAAEADQPDRARKPWWKFW